jgi:hypothetical protein
MNGIGQFRITGLEPRAVRRSEQLDRCVEKGVRLKVRWNELDKRWDILTLNGERIVGRPVWDVEPQRREGFEGELTVTDITTDGEVVAGVPFVTDFGGTVLPLIVDDRGYCDSDPKVDPDPDASA